jgi:hypothetical protein
MGETQNTSIVLETVEEDKNKVGYTPMFVYYFPTRFTDRNEKMITTYDIDTSHIIYNATNFFT